MFLNEKAEMLNLFGEFKYKGSYAKYDKEKNLGEYYINKK